MKGNSRRDLRWWLSNIPAIIAIIPTRYLIRSATYEIILTLTNFLGATSSSTPIYVGVVAERALPSVKISPSSASIYRSEALDLFADATISTCSDATSLSYAWHVSGGNGAGIAPFSSDPRHFRVAANKFVAGNTYSINTTVTDSAGNANTASATVTVKRSAIDVSISGGNRAVGASTALTLDASGSNDPDSDDGAQSISFNWTCSRGDVNFGQPCLAYASDGGWSLSPLSLIGMKPYVGYLPQGTYTFTVIGTTKDGRSDSAATTIVVVGGTPPSVKVDVQCDTGSSCNLARINPSKKVIIEGYANVTSSSHAGSSRKPLYVAQWTNEEGTFNDGKSFTSATSSSLSQTVQAMSGMLSFSLVLKGDSLVDGSSYTFRLTVASRTDPTSSGYSEISFMTNAAPTSGTFDVTPLRGHVLTTSFSLSDEGWVDDADDYPLYYSFYYIDPSDPKQKVNNLAANSLYPSISTLLPEVRSHCLSWSILGEWHVEISSSMTRDNNDDHFILVPGMFSFPVSVEH